MLGVSRSADDRRAASSARNHRRWLRLPEFGRFRRAAIVDQGQYQASLCRCSNRGDRRASRGAAADCRNAGRAKKTTKVCPYFSNASKWCARRFQGPARPDGGFIGQNVFLFCASEGARDGVSRRALRGQDRPHVVGRVLECVARSFGGWCAARRFVRKILNGGQQSTPAGISKSWGM